MATIAELKKLAGKAIEDEEFRAAFDADPGKAAASIGITLTPEQLAEIKKNREAARLVETRESKGYVVVSG